MNPISQNTTTISPVIHVNFQIHVDKLMAGLLFEAFSGIQISFGFQSRNVGESKAL